MKKFEYLKKSYGIYRDGQNSITESELNELGSQGWELKTECTTETVHSYIFIREICNQKG